MAEVQLDGAAIKDWDSFHAQCAERFGFPAFYGQNMNAWIDCLTYVRAGDGMSRFSCGDCGIYIFAFGRGSRVVEIEYSMDTSEPLGVRKHGIYALILSTFRWESTSRE